MACKTIHAAETNLLTHLFTTEEDTEDTRQKPGILIGFPSCCCSYGSYGAASDIIWETEDDE